MKEFFVADGVVRLLLNDLNSARAFLRAGRLGYEILDFAGTLIKKKSTNYQKLLTERLTGMIFESRGINSELQKQQLSALSANCAGILHYSGLGFPGKDWSGLLLDNAVLSGEDLSYKNLSGSSMQYAHLENSDLTGSDLRYCDFTGVSFEKSGQLISFSVDPQETALYACYRDGKLRRWDTLTGNTKAVTILPPEKQLSIIIRGEQKEGIITAESFKFLRRGADKLELSGYTPLKAGMRLLDLCGDAVLFELSNELYLMNIIDNTVIYQHETDGRYKACLLNSSTIVFRSAKGGLELINALKSESSCTVIPTEQPVNSIFAVAFSENDGIIAATVSPISPEA